MFQSLTGRKEWKFFGVLPKADPGLAAAWWTVLLLRGILPAAFAIAMGVLVGAVERGDRLTGPLALVGAIFVLLQVLSPIHQAVSSNLGDRTAAWLYDRLTEACVRPPGMGHLEDPALTSDLTIARLEMVQGSLLAGNITVGDQFVWTSGTVGGSGHGSPKR